MQQLMYWGHWLASFVPKAASDKSQRDQGSVTIENVIWAIAVIAIAAIVVAAITAYVTSHSSQLVGS